MSFCILWLTCKKTFVGCHGKARRIVILVLHERIEYIGDYYTVKFNKRVRHIFVQIERIFTFREEIHIKTSDPWS